MDELVEHPPETARHEELSATQVALSIPKIIEQILKNVDHPRCLAVSARVSVLWHKSSIKWLWQGAHPLQRPFVDYMV